MILVSLDVLPDHLAELLLFEVRLALRKPFVLAFLQQEVDYAPLVLLVVHLIHVMELIHALVVLGMVHVIYYPLAFPPVVRLVNASLHIG